MTAFEVLNAIFEKKKVNYKQSDLPPYIISLWLSHDRALIDMVNRVNEIQFELPPEMVFKYYFYKAPKGRRYIKWTKKKEIFDEKLKEKIEEERERLNISKIEMKKYLPILEKEWKGNR